MSNQDERPEATELQRAYDEQWRERNATIQKQIDEHVADMQRLMGEVRRMRREADVDDGEKN